MIGSNPIQDFIKACESLIIYEAITQGKLKIEANQQQIGEYGLIARCDDSLTALILYSRRDEIENVMTQIRIPEIKIMVGLNTYRTITAHLKKIRSPMQQQNLQIPVLSQELQANIKQRSNC